MKIIPTKVTILVYFFFLNLLLGFGQTTKNQSYIEIDSIKQDIDIYSKLERFIEKGNQKFDYERLKDQGFAIPEELKYYVPVVDSMKARTIWMRCTLKNQTQDDLLYYYILRHWSVYL